jgi:hypothetical protein
VGVDVVVCVTCNKSGGARKRLQCALWSSGRVHSECSSWASRVSNMESHERRRPCQAFDYSALASTRSIADVSRTKLARPLLSLLEDAGHATAGCRGLDYQTRWCLSASLQECIGDHSLGKVSSRQSNRAAFRPPDCNNITASIYYHNLKTP